MLRYPDNHDLDKFRQMAEKERDEFAKHLRAQLRAMLERGLKEYPLMEWLLHSLDRSVRLGNCTFLSSSDWEMIRTEAEPKSTMKWSTVGSVLKNYIDCGMVDAAACLPKRHILPSFQ